MSKLDEQRLKSIKVGNLISVEEFFRNYDPGSEFTSFYESLNSTDQQGLDSAFYAIEHKIPLNNGHVSRFDAAGKPYVFADIKFSKGTQGIKIPLFGKMQNFIKDYQMGKVNIAFSLEDLYSEATSREADLV